jgi:hypothetical protein
MMDKTLKDLADYVCLKNANELLSTMLDERNKNDISINFYISSGVNGFSTSDFENVKHYINGNCREILQNLRDILTREQYVLFKSLKKFVEKELEDVR